VKEDCQLHLTVITGLSGAGKSEAMATFEDMGYFCIDNLPPQMLPRVVDLFCLEGSRVDRVALVFDVRAGTYFEQLGKALAYLREAGITYRLLYLEASEEALVARYQSTRRPHPLSRTSPVEGLQRERAVVSPLRSQADMVIDTTGMSPRQLRRRLEETLLAERLSDQLFLSMVSFGYKFGLPDEADIVLDSRFLPNPYWVTELRPLSGLDEPVRRHVLGLDGARSFVDHIVEMVRFVGPRFLSEQKPRVVLAVGCTGGRHRSVLLVEELARRLQEEPGVVTSVSHRDIDRAV
jgi:RNase adapter protein RapZ